jgi:hypothetical protein
MWKSTERIPTFPQRDIEFILTVEGRFIEGTENTEVSWVATEAQRTPTVSSVGTEAQVPRGFVGFAVL